MKIKWQLLFAGLMVCGAAIGFFLTQRGDLPDKSENQNTSEKPVVKSTPPVSPETKLSSSEPKALIKWHSYNDGMALGKDKNKKVFLNFYADWCGYCKQMDSKTFTDKSVISYMNENFIPVRVNADKEMKIAAQYEVRGLPVSWFIAESGESIGSQPGYIPPDMLLPILKYIHTDSYKKMSFDKFAKNAG
jgi:thioredoxin-related protein